MENKVSLGTYSFTFTSVYMKEDKMFIIRNRIDLLSKSINHRIPSRMKMNRESIRCTLEVIHSILPVLKNRRLGMGGGRELPRITLVEAELGLEPDDLVPSYPLTLCSHRGWMLQDLHVPFWAGHFF